METVYSLINGPGERRAGEGEVLSATTSNVKVLEACRTHLDIFVTAILVINYPIFYLQTYTLRTTLSSWKVNRNRTDSIKHVLLLNLESESYYPNSRIDSLLSSCTSPSPFRRDSSDIVPLALLPFLPLSFSIFSEERKPVGK